MLLNPLTVRGGKKSLCHQVTRGWDGACPLSCGWQVLSLVTSTNLSVLRCVLTCHMSSPPRRHLMIRQCM